MDHKDSEPEIWAPADNQDPTYTWGINWPWKFKPQNPTSTFAGSAAEESSPPQLPHPAEMAMVPVY